ncbi:MAG: GPW/gp25 family protein [Pseudomonadota bacterium]
MSEAGQSFLGRGWAFPPRFMGSNLRCQMVSREDDIVESLTILFSTALGERIMRPDYGCKLRDMVFDSITETNLARMRAEIERAVLFWEPRVDLHSVSIRADEALEGRLLLSLQYTIRTTNTRSNVVFPYYYKEGTHLAETVWPDEDLAEMLES